MKTKIFYLKGIQKNSFLIQPIITWVDPFGRSTIPTPDLIILIELFYFSN